MIIKEVNIKNFRSYYGNDNRFVFSDGLTLILGDNGDGKTTFFDALRWLFDTTKDNNSIDHVSEMRKSKLEIDEQDEVSVSILFEHDGEKLIEKSFSFKKVDENKYNVGKITYRGYETNGSERQSVDAKFLMNHCYDAFIQHYSMFKGESDLDVFKGKNAIKELVDKLSDIKKFDDLVQNTKSFKEKANEAYVKELKLDKKVSKDAVEIESKIDKLSGEISQVKKDINDKRLSIESFSSKLDNLEQNQEASERYRDIKERLKNKEDKANKLKGKIASVNLSHNLLDSFWILCAFPPLLQEFKQKSSKLSKEKRTQEKVFTENQAAAKAKLETIKEIQGALINGATELPWYLPNQETMEEMINDHICKVCGRVAPEGSDAYIYMRHRLNEYKAHVMAKIKKEEEIKKLEEEKLFKNDYIEEIHNLSISLSGSNESRITGIATEIDDLLKLNSRLKEDLKELQEKIQDIKDEKTRLLIQTGNVSESLLDSQYQDIKGLFEQRERANVRLTQLTDSLNAMESNLRNLIMEREALKPSSSQVEVFRGVYKVLEEISIAFESARKNNLNRFLSTLEEKANTYLVAMSANDFHGEIRLIQKADNSTEIRLFSTNGSEVKNPSTSQKTTMYISVLFAISDFTQQKRDEDYPLIFDAATSSFGDSKEKDFYNIIDKLNKQCIIVTKDFISNGKVREKDIDSLSCSVYRIKKATGFDLGNMATIRTTIEKLK